MFHPLAAAVWAEPTPRHPSPQYRRVLSPTMESSVGRPDTAESGESNMEAFEDTMESRRIQLFILQWGGAAGTEPERIAQLDFACGVPRFSPCRRNTKRTIREAHCRTCYLAKQCVAAGPGPRRTSQLDFA